MSDGVAFGLFAAIFLIGIVVVVLIFWVILFAIGYLLYIRRARIAAVKREEIARLTVWTYSADPPTTFQQPIEYINEQIRNNGGWSRSEAGTFFSGMIRNDLFVSFEAFSSRYNSGWKRYAASLFAISTLDGLIGASGGNVHSGYHSNNIWRRSRLIRRYYRGVMFLCRDVNLPQFAFVKNGLTPDQVHASSEQYNIITPDEQTLWRMLSPELFHQLIVHDISLVFGLGNMLCLLAKRNAGEFPDVRTISQMLNVANFVAEMLRTGIRYGS